jgi:hypothetical protein
MSRKIKDIKDKHTGELVYPRTHISAVAVSSGSTMEDLVDTIETLREDFVYATNEEITDIFEQQS